MTQLMEPVIMLTVTINYGMTGLL